MKIAIQVPDLDRVRPTLRRVYFKFYKVFVLINSVGYYKNKKPNVSRAKHTFYK